MDDDNERIAWQEAGAPEPPDLPDLKTRALEIYENSRGVTIENTEERIKAEAMLVLIKKNINSFKDLLNPGIEAAKSTLKTLKDKRGEIMDPLSAAYNMVKGCVGAYYQKEEDERRKIQEEEDRRLEVARRKEREAMAEVIKAEEKGDIEKADELLKIQADVEIEVVTTPPVQMPPPKMKGISSRMIPKWEVTDPSKLPVAYRTIVPIRPKITGLVKAHGPEEAMRLCPGIRAWEESSTAVKV